jgi:hypothetical protein
VITAQDQRADGTPAASERNARIGGRHEAEAG